MIIDSIDIGTNTVLLLIASVKNTGEIHTILNEFRIPRIGRNLLPGRPIKDENVDKLFEVLKDYGSIISIHKCDKVLVTATHALRIASNSGEIISRISKDFNWKVDLISGEEEASYAFEGAVINRNQNQEYLVIDIGGGSTEIIIGKIDKIHFRKSFKIGVVSGTENYLFKSPPDKTDFDRFKNFLDDMFQELKDTLFAPDCAIALAGTPATLSCMKQKLEVYNEELVEGSILTISDITILIEEISVHSVSELEYKYKSAVNGRQDIILAGAVILLEIMKILNLTKVMVSTKGIRYGAIAANLMKE